MFCPMPFSYNKYSGFKSGLGTRLGPLTVGVTDFRTLFATGKSTALYTNLVPTISQIKGSNSAE